MKIKSKNNLNKKTIIIVAVVTMFILAAGYTFIAHSKQLWPFLPSNDASEVTEKNRSNIDLMPATDEQKESAGGDKKDTPITGGDADKNPAPTPQQPAPGTTSSKQNVSVTVSNYSSTDSVFHINAIVNTLTAGTCTATIVKNGTVIGTKTGNTFAQSSYLSCTDLDIPKTKDMQGAVQIIVNFSNNTQEGKGSIDANI